MPRRPLSVLHPGSLLLAFFAVSIYATLCNSVLALALLGLGLLALLATCSPSGKLLHVIFWLNLLGIPGSMVFFVAAGWEAAGSLPGALRWAIVPAALYTLRLECLVFANLVLVGTTTPRALFALGPRWLPSGFRTLLVTAVRFVPLTISEAIRIHQVQRCRGLRLRLWSLRTWLPVLIPLFLAQMRRAHETALMLVVRRVLPTMAPVGPRPGFRPADWLVVGCSAGACLLQLGLLITQA